MLLALYLPKWLGFNHADQITIFFCSSKKTLASGVPITNLVYWATIGDDCVANYDFPPNSVDGVWGDRQSLVKIRSGIVRKFNLLVYNIRHLLAFALTWSLGESKEMVCCGVDLRV